MRGNLASEDTMSFRSKRTRLAHLSKVKDTTTQSVQDVVAQVIRDVATSDAQDADTLHSSCLNQNTNQAVVTHPSGVTSAEADDFGSREINTSRRPSPTPPPSQPSVSDPQRLRHSQRRSLRVQHTDGQLNPFASGGDHAQTELGSSGNPWANDTLVTEPTQGTSKETNDFRSQRNTAGRQSLTPAPSRSFATDSPSQLRGLERSSNWFQDGDGEPDQHGLSEARHSKPSNWSNDIEFEEMEDVENDEEPAQQGISQVRYSKPFKWRSDIKFDEMEEVEIRNSEGKRGKKGGRILPRHVWSLRPGVRFVVPFNSLDQPLRKGGHVLLRFLGDISKKGELCPIGEVNWPRVDKSCKANIIALVREKFVIPDRPEVDKCILKHVGNRWKSYRHDLKVQYYKPDKTQEQVANTVPRDVIPSQWVKLVQYWFSEKSKYLSEKGRSARAAQTHLHTTGSKSYARRRDEFEKAHGREPGALEWFLETHQRKDGTFVENTSKEFVDTAAAMIAQCGSTSTPKRRIAVENQVFNELMYSDDERLYQRPIGYGFGVNGNKVFGVEAELKKRGYLASGTSAEAGSSKRRLFRMGAERRKSGYMPQDSSVEVKRLNFAMTAMSETNELMQSQIKMQSQQLQMQSQQLQMQSKQIEGLQTQLQQVTSLLTKFGVMLNNPQRNSTPRGAHFQDFNRTSRQVPEASSDYSGGESDSTEWDSDE